METRFAIYLGISANKSIRKVSQWAYLLPEPTSVALAQHVDAAIALQEEGTSDGPTSEVDFEMVLLQHVFLNMLILREPRAFSKGL